MKILALGIRLRKRICKNFRWKKKRKLAKTIIKHPKISNKSKISFFNKKLLRRR